MKVVSMVPEARFKRFGVSFPEGWEVVYAPDDKPETVIPLVGDADFILAMAVSAVPASVIEAAPNCKLIHSEGVGFNKIDTDFARSKGIPVCNNRATNNVSVAEHTIGLILAGLRRTVRIDREIRAGKFLESQNTHRAEGSNEIAARHIGFYGIGAIGKEAARRLKAFGCKMSYFDVFRPTPEVEQELGISYLEFDELIKQCDIISIHVPVLPSTEKSISYKQFDMMPNNTLLVNTARGEVIDQAALIDALENDKIYGAVLDTLAPEPPQPDDPILHMSEKAMNKVTFTPHIGGTNDEAFMRMLNGAIANFQRVANGEQPVNVVN